MMNSIRFQGRVPVACGYSCRHKERESDYWYVAKTLVGGRGETDLLIVL